MLSSITSPGAFTGSLILLAAAVFPGSRAWSLEATGALNHTSEYTTNVARTDDDEEGEWIHSPGFTIGAIHNTATMDFSGDYTYERRIYEGEFDDEDVTTGSASALWRALPNRLDFFVNNSRSESTERAIDPDTPENRQVVSDTSAGSILRFQPRRGDELNLRYSYDVNTRENTNDDSQSHTGTIDYVLGLSPSRAVIFQGVYGENNYDNREDATSLTATIGYSETGRKVTIDVSAGYSDYQRDEEDSVNGGVYNAALTWETSGLSSLSFTASRGINDQSSSFYDRDDFDDTLAENSGTNDVFTETTGEIVWDQTLGANELSFAVYASQEDYEDVEGDNDRIGTRFSFSRDLTRTTTFDLGVDYSHREFDDEDDEQDEVNASIRFTHAIGRALFVNWGVTYENRDTETTESYDETTFEVGLTYTFLGVR
jgi:hypothetical protein